MTEEHALRVFIGDTHFDQDVQDPVWATDSINTGDVAGLGQHDGLRTSHGLIDHLHDLEDKAEDWIKRETDHAHGHKWPRNEDKMHPITTVPQAADKWRGITFSVVDEIRVVTANPKRRSVTIVNYGPGVVYLCKNPNTRTGPQINQITVPVSGPNVYAPRTFNHRDDIYAFPATVGTAATIDIQDEFYE